MKDISDLLELHPEKLRISSKLLADGIRNARECEQACTCCADACLAEEDIADLRACIRATQDCADVCGATSAMLSRLSSMNAETVVAQAAFCADVCRACAEECRQYAERHKHCQVCEEICLACEDACRRLVQAAPAAA